MCQKCQTCQRVQMSRLCQNCHKIIKILNLNDFKKLFCCHYPVKLICLLEFSKARKNFHDFLFNFLGVFQYLLKI